MSAIDRIENAFSIAEKEWSVPRLLNPKGTVTLLRADKIGLIRTLIDRK